MQAIQTTLTDLPIRVEIFHVKAHQDRDKYWSELDPSTQINILADRKADAIYRKHPDQTGLFPTCVPGTHTALFHGNGQVTHNIQRSQEATGRNKPWDEATYESIDWRHHGEAFKKLSVGRRIQISKYSNDLLPTHQRLQTIDNTVDG
jgi:hypothetical protein